MTARDSLTLQVADALSASGIPYLLAGSFASNFYGIPRSTEDADFVLQLHGGVDSKFEDKLGAGFHLDRQLTFETVTGTHRQYLWHTATSFKIELFMLSADPHDQERFARRREQPVFDRKVWLLSPEDVIISKLRWLRSKDKDDIRDVMAVQRNSLDWIYVEKWCRTHGTFEEMLKLKQLSLNP